MSNLIAELCKLVQIKMYVNVCQMLQVRWWGTLFWLDKKSGVPVFVVRSLGKDGEGKNTTQEHVVSLELPRSE